MDVSKEKKKVIEFLEANDYDTAFSISEVGTQMQNEFVES